MLKFMDNERIFSTKLSENKSRLTFQEGCDDYFSVSLTKLQLLKLISDLQNLANQMKHEDKI